MTEPSDDDPAICEVCGVEVVVCSDGYLRHKFRDGDHRRHRIIVKQDSAKPAAPYCADCFREEEGHSMFHPFVPAPAKARKGD